MASLPWCIEEIQFFFQNIMDQTYWNEPLKLVYYSTLYRMKPRDKVSIGKNFCRLVLVAAVLNWWLEFVLSQRVVWIIDFRYLTLSQMACYCLWFRRHLFTLHVLIMPRTRFRVNPHSIGAWMSRNSFFKASLKSEV